MPPNLPTFKAPPQRELAGEYNTMHFWCGTTFVMSEPGTLHASCILVWHCIGTVWLRLAGERHHSSRTPGCMVRVHLVTAPRNVPAFSVTSRTISQAFGCASVCDPREVLCCCSFLYSTMPAVFCLLAPDALALNISLESAGIDPGALRWSTSEHAGGARICSARIHLEVTKV